jgi:TPR repeat protein
LERIFIPILRGIVTVTTLIENRSIHYLTNVSYLTIWTYSICYAATVVLPPDEGDPEAMVIYARLVESGEHIEQNVKEAAGFFQRAAEAGCPAGMHEYARCWLHGIGVRQSDAKAPMISRQNSWSAPFLHINQ